MSPLSIILFKPFFGDSSFFSPFKHIFEFIKKTKTKINHGDFTCDCMGWLESVLQSRNNMELAQALFNFSQQRFSQFLVHRSCKCSQIYSLAFHIFDDTVTCILILIHIFNCLLSANGDVIDVTY